MVDINIVMCWFLIRKTLGIARALGDRAIEAQVRIVNISLRLVFF